MMIVNTNSREEYNNKINYYQVNGFDIASSTTSNLQTRLVKKNIGPAWIQVLLILSLIASILYLTELVMYPLAISDLFIKLNLFSLLLAISYLQYVGILFLIIFVAMLILTVYYYFTKPYEVLVKLNMVDNGQQMINGNGNYNNYNQNGGNYYG